MIPMEYIVSSLWIATLTDMDDHDTMEDHHTTHGIGERSVFSRIS